MDRALNSRDIIKISTITANYPIIWFCSVPDIAGHDK